MCCGGGVVFCLMCDIKEQVQTFFHFGLITKSMFLFFSDFKSYTCFCLKIEIKIKSSVCILNNIRYYIFSI